MTNMRLVVGAGLVMFFTSCAVELEGRDCTVFDEFCDGGAAYLCESTSDGSPARVLPDAGIEHGVFVKYDCAGANGCKEQSAHVIDCDTDGAENSVCPGKVEDTLTCSADKRLMLCTKESGQYQRHWRACPATNPRCDPMYVGCQ